VEAVPGRASGEAGGEGGRAALEVAARAEHRVGVDHGAGIAPGDMLAEMRLIDRLVVDAGVGLHHADRAQMPDQLAFLAHHLRVLEQPLGDCEVDAAGVGGDRDAKARLLARPGAQKLEPGIAHDLHVAHHVGTGHRHHALGAEETADLDLHGQCPLGGLAIGSIEHRLLVGAELQLVLPAVPGTSY
jgi:hypothetical protein